MKYAYTFGLLTLLMMFLPGCGAARKPLHIEPVKEASAIITPNFTEAYYRVDRDGTLFYYLATSSSDASTQQILLIRQFWQPIGGRTTLNPTALNSTWRYLVMSPNSVAMYEGAGFIRNLDSAGDSPMKARLVDGSLLLTEATADFTDNLGRCRIRGTFYADYNDALTLDKTLQAQRTFFNRSFELARQAPKPTPDTQPTATQPAATSNAPVMVPNPPLIAPTTVPAPATQPISPQPELPFDRGR